jgi:two-component system, NtrC family, sensor kinase
MTGDGPTTHGLADELVDVFKRLAEGDLTARVPRNFKRDSEDAIAFFVGVFAEQLEERHRSHREYEVAVAGLIEKFIALAGGDFGVRAERTYRRDPVDTLAFLLNNVAVEIGDLVGDHDRQRMLLETVIESMLDGVLLLDPEGRIRSSNAAMASLLGHASGALVGLHVSDVLVAAEHELAARLTDPLILGPIRNRDTLFRGKDGAVLTMAVNGSPHRDAEGRLLGIVLVARDDRELKNARARLEITDRLATMGTLAAGVAHEINNPLAFISANVDFVLEELEEVARGAPLSGERLAEIIRALGSSRNGAARVRHIVQELRGFTRAGPETVAPVDLNTLLESALVFAGNEIRHHARLTKDYGAPPLVLANEGRLVQAFLNLLQNAAQSISMGAAEKNEIRVVTGACPDGAFVEVRDTGCGIPEENLPRVFDLFYTTKSVGIGVGLGLSIALRLIEKAGGRLDVESRVGVGSVFRAVLPGAAPREKRSQGHPGFV